MITIQDLITRYGEQELAHVSDRQSRKVIDVDVINKAIGDAEGEVEGYLNAVGLVSRNLQGDLVYLKATTVPKSLVIKTCDIARYYLAEKGATGTIKERYDNAIEWLKLVMKNPTMLTGISQIEGSTTANSGVFVMPMPTPSNWID